MRTKKGEFFADLGEALDQAFAMADEMGGPASPYRAVLITDDGERKFPLGDWETGGVFRNATQNNQG